MGPHAWAHCRTTNNMKAKGKMKKPSKRPWVLDSKGREIEHGWYEERWGNNGTGNIINGMA